MGGIRGLGGEGQLLADCKATVGKTAPAVSAKAAARAIRGPVASIAGAGAT